MTGLPPQGPQFIEGDNMPTYGGTPVLTVGKFNQARKIVNDWFDRSGWPDMPTPYKPGHEGAFYCLSLEGGPEEWPYLASLALRDELAAINVFAEPVNHYCLALHPA